MIGSAIGHVSGIIGGGGGAAAIGDIIFAAARPSLDYIDLTTKRVYLDDYPALGKIFQPRLENDGGEWLQTRPFQALVDAYAGVSDPDWSPAAHDVRDSSFPPTMLGGGVVGAENVAVLWSQKSLFTISGPASGYTFDTYRRISSFQKNSSYPRIIYANGDVSTGGTIVVQTSEHDGTNVLPFFYRSIDGGRTFVKRRYAEMGVSSAAYYCKLRHVKDQTWILADTQSNKAYISQDDGQSFQALPDLPQNKDQNGTARFVFYTSHVVIFPNGWIGLIFYQPRPSASYITNALYLLSQTGEFLGAYGGQVGIPASGAFITAAAGLDGTDAVVGLNATATNGENLTLLRFPNTGTNSSFENTDGLPGAADASHLLFDSWDAYSYLLVGGVGLLQRTGSTWGSRRAVSPGSLWTPPTRLISTRENPGGGRLLKFARFALTPPDNNASGALVTMNDQVLQARPSAQARQYLQITDQGNIGGPRIDGKKPFMKAR